MKRTSDDLGDLRRLHDEVDAAAGRLQRHHAEHLECRRGCSGCCVDDLQVFEVEAERIRRTHAELLTTGTPHAAGACAFLDADGSCRVYADRPYVCRTQGLPLRWIEEDDGGRPVEYRDICELNQAVGPLPILDASACWPIGPAETKLRGLQEQFGRGELTRVRLRDLFERGGTGG